MIRFKGAMRRFLLILLFISIASSVAFGILVNKAQLADWAAANLPAWLWPTAPPLKADELVILTLPHAQGMQYKAGEPGRAGWAGFEYDLAALFAKERGLTPRVVVLPSRAALIQALQKGQGHIAAADIAMTGELRSAFSFGPSYRSIQHVLIGPDETKIQSLSEALFKRITFIANTPAHDLLRELTGPYPGIILEPLPESATPEAPLRQIEVGLAEFAVVDAASFAAAKRLHPGLSRFFHVGPTFSIAWMYAPVASSDLQHHIALFFERIRGNGALHRLTDRYYGHIERIQPADAEMILEKIQTVLPQLRPYFHEAQHLSGIDWRTLAAVSYQESHWDAEATSPTGVRGLMMLTEETAQRMGVKDRLNPREAILGGAKYLALLRDTVPSRIAEPDRTWLALAAYNQGYGHLEDARILAQRMGLNPDSWIDVRKAYLRMSDPVVYNTLKNGYCRGDEAVTLVDNIRNYTDILHKLEQPLGLQPSF